MKYTFKILGFTALCTLMTLSGVSAAKAENSNLETGIQQYGDLSMFFQAAANTGLFNELRDDQHYTVFAPTNAAFREIQPKSYPCFYAAQCRPQIAALLRNHIIVGRYDLDRLVSYGGGVQTAGQRSAHVEEAYIGDYRVDGRKILSRTDVDGNIIYRIDGVLANRQDLATFQQVNYVPGENTGVTTQRTITTYRSPTDDPSDMTETTTIIRNTTVQP
jgi:uncharacterized surface protein with fasciclin (FAS1) repeats